MREYKTKISLVKNMRGVWDLDPFKGCNYGMAKNKNGCYGICYAAKIAKFRGYDFSKLVYRDFENEKHFKQIANKLKTIEFIRLGVMCDPSSDWDHTLNIVEKIKPYQKNIVIITKHWTELKEEHLIKLKGICVNTSVSALDSDIEIKYRVEQYNILKSYCNSVLRVNTAHFRHKDMVKRQKYLLKNEKVLDNILRIPKSNSYSKLMVVKEYKFLNSNVYASKHNENIYFDNCKNCNEKCGINLK